MSRVNENEEMVNAIIEKNETLGETIYQEAIILGLSDIESILLDISRSLAIIADKTENEGGR